MTFLKHFWGRSWCPPCLSPRLWAEAASLAWALQAAPLVSSLGYTALPPTRQAVTLCLGPFCPRDPAPAPGPHIHTGFGSTLGCEEGQGFPD